MVAEKRKGVGNVHVHHLIGDYIPAKIFYQQVNKYKKCLSNKKFVKYVIGCPPLRPLIWLFLGNQECKFLMLLRADKISKARKIHLKEMKKAGIDYSVVLLLDYTFAAGLNPEEAISGSNRPLLSTLSYKEILSRYEKQLHDTALSLAEEPFRFFLFYNFDPRRENALDLLEKSYKSYGAVGIKLYPALGFHPVPQCNRDFYCANDILLNPAQSNEERIKMLRRNLEAMYIFAEQKDLPILTHCSPGGSFLTLVDENKIKKEKLWEFSHPENYRTIVHKYNVRICLAHMGGKIHLEPKPSEKELIEEEKNSIEWRRLIKELIIDDHDFNNCRGRIFTDLSFDLSRVVKNKEKLPVYIDDTQEYLNDPVIGHYVIFGSDWPMGLYLYPEKEYIRLYREGTITSEQQHLFFQDNTVKFLFGEERRIPDNYIQFLEKYRKGKKIKIPPWINRRNGDYYLV